MTFAEPGAEYIENGLFAIGPNRVILHKVVGDTVSGVVNSYVTFRCDRRNTRSVNSIL